MRCVCVSVCVCEVGVGVVCMHVCVFVCVHVVQEVGITVKSRLLTNLSL